jgi:hypothetical protein
MVLVQQEMVNSSHGGISMSHGVDETEEVAETNWTHEQDVEEELQQVVHDQPQHEVDDNEDEVGGEMIVDQGELEETIVDEMELDDEKCRTFIGG